MMHYLYSVYDSEKESFGSVSSFPSDDAAVDFFVNFFLQGSSFPKIELYRIGIFNPDTGSIEQTTPLSLRDSVMRSIEFSIEHNKSFRDYILTFVDTHPYEPYFSDLEEGSSDET